MFGIQSKIRCGYSTGVDMFGEGKMELPPKYRYQYEIYIAK